MFFGHAKHSGHIMFPQGCMGTNDGAFDGFYRLSNFGIYTDRFISQVVGSAKCFFLSSAEGLIVLVLVVKFVPEIFYNQHHSSESPLSSGAPR